MNYLALNTGIDYLFLEGNTIIHQPTLKEIAFIGEQSFWLGCNFLTLEKNNFSNQQADKSISNEITDFEILMSIIKSPNVQIQKEIIDFKMFLSLLFPTSEIIFFDDRILIKAEGAESGFLDKNNFGAFKEIIKKMFCINSKQQQDTDFHPVGEMSARIAQKLKEGREKAAKAKGEVNKDDSICIIERYLSILASLNKKDKNILSNYTIFQLFDEYERSSLLKDYEQNISIRLAGGGKDLDDPPNWKDNIHK